MQQPWVFPQLIKTDQDYNLALEQVYGLMQRDDVAPNTAVGDDFEHLVLLIEDYEAKHHLISPPHPIEAIKFRMEQSGMTEAELSKLLGGRSRKSEILNGTRKLSLSMIRKLHEKLKIPAEILIGAY